MKIRALLALILMFLSACESFSHLGSSEPINEKEKLQYQQELLRCVKTGGTRIVKVRGILHCY